MRTQRTLTFVILGTLGLPLWGCGGVSLWAETQSPRDPVPDHHARMAAPLTDRDATTLVRAFWDERRGEVPAPGEMREVTILRGSFTRPDAEEAVVAFWAGTFRDDAWQAWLLQRRGSSWYVLRNVVSGCSGTVTAAPIERGRPAVLLVRDSCTRFGQERGRVRLLSVGLTTNVERFAAPEYQDAYARVGLLRQRHVIRLADIDGDGVAEIIDTTETLHRSLRPSATLQVSYATTAQAIYKRQGQRFLMLHDPDDHPLTHKLLAELQ